MKKNFIFLFVLFPLVSLAETLSDSDVMYRYNLLEASTYTASSGFTTSTPIYWLWDGSTAEGVNDSKATGDTEAWIEFDFGREEEIAEAKLFQDNGGNRVTNWKIMCWTGTAWEDVFPYVQCGSAGWQSQTFNAKTSKIRFYAKCMINGNYVSIHEIELYTKPSAEQRKILIGCVGDSNTAGSGASEKGCYAWPIQLGGILGSAYQVKNFGESGTTLMQSADKPWTGTAQYQRHLNYGTTVSIIALGTNDSKNKNWKTASAVNFYNDFINLITEFQNYPSKPEVMLLIPIKAFPTTSYDINNDVIDGEIRPIIRNIAKTLGVALIDGYSTTENLENLMPDHIHLNDEGLRILAEKVASVLQTQKPILTVSGSASATTYAEYRWYRNGALLPQATAASYTATEAGVYKVAVKLSASTDDVIVSDSLDVIATNVNLVVSDKLANNILYNNNNQVVVSCMGNNLKIGNAEGLRFELFDVFSKNIISATIHNNCETINIAHLPNGVYIYQAGMANGKIVNF